MAKYSVSSSERIIGTSAILAFNVLVIYGFLTIESEYQYLKMILISLLFICLIVDLMSSYVSIQKESISMGSFFGKRNYFYGDILEIKVDRFIKIKMKNGIERNLKYKMNKHSDFLIEINDFKKRYNL
jgi:hypothetical protein